MAAPYNLNYLSVLEERKEDPERPCLCEWIDEVDIIPSEMSEGENYLFMPDWAEEQNFEEPRVRRRRTNWMDDRLWFE